MRSPKRAILPLLIPFARFSRATMEPSKRNFHTEHFGETSDASTHFLHTQNAMTNPFRWKIPLCCNPIRHPLWELSLSLPITSSMVTSAVIFRAQKASRDYEIDRISIRPTFSQVFFATIKAKPRTNPRIKTPHRKKLVRYMYQKEFIRGEFHTRHNRLLDTTRDE